VRLLLPALALCFASSAEAQQLEVHFLEVGQGDCTLVIGPDGTTFLFDGGPNGEGANTLVPYLQGLGITSLDYVAASHYHADHIGGLDEVWQSGILASVCLDRGDSNTPSSQSFADYESTYSGIRQTAVPGLVIQLGSGATATCLVVEGALIGGGSIDISGSAQYENSASIAWRIEYGNFDLYIAGDLTGGGNGSTDVEDVLGPLCGDLDVLRASHHGSSTSTQAAFLADVKPEAAIISCGSGNQYGFPRQDTIDNLNRWDRVIPVWCTSDGTGGTGFVDAGGPIRLESNGVVWSLHGADGLSLTAHCDETHPLAPAAGELAVSEIMRNPTVVADDTGEWIEIAGARVGQPVSLNGIEIGDGGVDLFRLATSIQLDAGEVCLIAASGLVGANGGVRPQIAWPVGSQQLANTIDAIGLRDSTTGIVLDYLHWTTLWPGGTGTSAERRDLLSPNVKANYLDGISSYGLGDLGSPGRKNDADVTAWGNGPTRVIVTTFPSVGGNLAMDWVMPEEAGRYFQGWVSFGTSPGVTVGGTHIPANLDLAYRTTNKLAGWSGWVPAAETVSVQTKMPKSTSLRGVTIYGIVVTLDLPDQIRTQAVPVAMIVL
jgi:beta-lactamase superfamily II metal-dependent hydrolase